MPISTFPIIGICQWKHGRAIATRVFMQMVWFGLTLNVPVNNFSVMFGRSHRFLGITSTFFFWGGVAGK